MKQDESDEIVAFAKQQFAFLKAEKGFTRPLINRPSCGLLIYRSATMEVCIEMSLWSRGMEVVVRMLGSDGKRARGENRSTIWLLESLLTRQFQVQDEHIVALDRIRLDLLKDRWQEKKWVKGQWEEVIRLYQALLRDHIDLILRQPFEVLFPFASEDAEDWWERLLHDNFAFLGEYGFRSFPVFAVDSWLYIYTWLSADRGIQLIADGRDKGMYCDVISLIDGKIPATDKKVLKEHDDFTEGQGVKISLLELLGKQLGITDLEIEQAGNLHDRLEIRHWSDYDERYVSTFVMEHANLVRRYINVLMDTPLELIFASARANYCFIDV
jgi:hypothetical protein